MFWITPCHSLCAVGLQRCYKYRNSYLSKFSSIGTNSASNFALDLVGKVCVSILSIHSKDSLKYCTCKQVKTDSMSNSARLRCHKICKSDATLCWIGIAFCFAALFSGSEVLLYYAAARASRVLHETCLKHVLRAPMVFFDTIPIGRIVSRFSQDMDSVDTRLPAIVVDWLYCLLEVNFDWILRVTKQLRLLPVPFFR